MILRELLGELGAAGAQPILQTALEMSSGVHNMTILSTIIIVGQMATVLIPTSIIALIG